MMDTRRETSPADRAQAPGSAPIKYAIVVMDGAADEPLAQLDGMTPLQKAHIPNTDWISTNGRQGIVRTVPDSLPPGSDVALMSVLGYDPKACYSGRAPLEAAAMGIKTAPSDWMFRCNFVTVADGIMLDYSAGHIDSVQAAELITELNRRLAGDELAFYPGVGYRHIMVHHQGPFDCHTTPPHDITDQPIAKHLPKGKNAKKLCSIMERAVDVLASHDINKVRSDLGENPANHIWLWGQGTQPQIDRFSDRFGVSGAVITAVDLLRGLAKLSGMKTIDVDGATGYFDTNYVGKGQAAVAALAKHDLILVHVEAPDEASHGALIDEKIKAIEQIDLHIVGPLLKELRTRNAWRMMVLPDHPTPIRLRTHSAEPVPFAIAGTGIESILQQPYTEANARDSGLRIDRGHQLMEYFLKVK